jgi:DNA-directed RNA polymerase specialized sigma24 family protein
VPDEDPLDRLSTLYAKEYEEEIEMREEVQYLLSLVSEKDRSLLELCYLHGLDGNALALELKCSCIAVHKRLYRARQRLRTALIRAERRAL